MASCSVALRSELLESEFGNQLAWKEIGMDARYLLMVLIEQFWNTGGVTSPVKQLARQLGLGQTAFSHSVHELIRGGLLVRTQHYKEGHRGRPWFRYDVSPRLRQMIRELEPQLLIFHKQTISHCCLPKSPTSSTLVASLTRREKVVLCTLLANADQLGLVKTKSEQDICRLTGLHKRKLDKTVRRLQESGHIQRYIPGFSAQLTDVFRDSIFGLDHRLLDRFQGTHTVNRLRVLATWEEIHSDLLLRELTLKPTPERGESSNTHDSVTTIYKLYSDMLWSQRQQPPASYERIFFSLQDHASALVLAHIHSGENTDFLPTSMMGLGFYKRVRRDFIPSAYRTLDESGRYPNRKATARVLFHIFSSINAIAWSIHLSVSGLVLGQVIALNVMPGKLESDRTIMVAGLKPMYSAVR